MRNPLLLEVLKLLSLQVTSQAMKVIPVPNVFLCVNYFYGHYYYLLCNKT